MPKDFKPPYASYYSDIEWRLLVFLHRYPDFMALIKPILPEPAYFMERTGKTDHSLIYHAMLDLYDEGEPLNLTTLYTKCEGYRRDRPLSHSYSRADILELDFQAMPFSDTRDNNRIEAQYITGKLKERYLKQQ
jgi:hypothetical protein